MAKLKKCLSLLLCLLGIHRWYGQQVGCSLLLHCTVCGKKETRLVRLWLFVKK
jgi:hypothetical protein